MSVVHCILVGVGFGLFVLAGVGVFASIGYLIFKFWRYVFKGNMERCAAAYFISLLFIVAAVLRALDCAGVLR